MSRENIFNEIDLERQYQEQKWGNDIDDTVNKPNDFIAYINHYGTRWFNGGFAPYPPEAINKFRESMIKTAAIAVAAVESLDRQRTENSHAHYER